WLHSRIDCGISGEPGAGSCCVSGNFPRSAGIGWRSPGDGTSGPAGYVDSGATRVVGGSYGIAARGVNPERVERWSRLTPGSGDTVGRLDPSGAGVVLCPYPDSPFPRANTSL